MNMPMISVLMPVFNGEKYLREAIESILNQTYGDFEFIILNDGSTDKTEEIIVSYDDPRIVYVKNEENLGIVGTLNKGISLAKGKYIARMDADDISLPNRFEKQIAFLEQHLECSVVFSTVLSVNSKGELLLMQWQDDRECIAEGEIKKALPKKNVLAHPAAMARSEVFKAYHYDGRSKHAEDYNLWLRLVSEGYRLCKVVEPLLKYRVSSDSITQISNQKNRYSALSKNINAQYRHLIYKLKGSSLNRFDLRVLVYMLNNSMRIVKVFLREFLRKWLIIAGEYSWYIYSKKIDDTDILFLFKSTDLGGAERVHLDILRIVRAQGYKIKVLFTHRSRNKHFLSEYQKVSYITDTSWLTNNILGRWFFAGFLRKVIEHSNISVVFGSISGLIYDITNKHLKASTKFIDLLHAFDNNIEYYSLCSVPMLHNRIVIDKRTYEMLCELYAKNGLDDHFCLKTQLIENGVEVPKTLQQKNYTAFRALYIGRDAPVKRVYLIEAVAQGFASVDFTFAGISPNKDVAKNMEYLGNVKDPRPYYKKAHVLLLSSEREGFPMVVMEAMAYGVIPVVTDVGGLSTHIRNGYNGFLISDTKGDENIIKDFIAILQILKNDTALYERVSNNAYQYAREHFDIRIFEQKYKELFLKYLEKGSG